jgi:ribose/xylose/arabinose/galactoside ABC-type transport system permease subunit
MKVLYHDLARLLRRPYSATSADAANCYDRVHHIIMALLLWALGMPMGPIAAMLLTIASMRYYIRTGFGESKTFMGGEKATARMHGLNQGNRAASHCWSLLSA